MGTSGNTLSRKRRSAGSSEHFVGLKTEEKRIPPARKKAVAPGRHRTGTRETDRDRRRIHCAPRFCRRRKRSTQSLPGAKKDPAVSRQIACRQLERNPSPGLEKL